jgi:hypothetical protein
LKLGPVMVQTIGSSQFLNSCFFRCNASSLVSTQGYEFEKFTWVDIIFFPIISFEIVCFKKETLFIRVAWVSFTMLFYLFYPLKFNSF